MEPITREEYYLAKIAGTYKGKTPKPVTIEEYYLATMAGDYSGNTLQPVTRLQYYMAKVAGVWDGSIPAPVTRLEYYWAAIANGEGEVFPPVTREEHFLTLVADAYSVVLTVVTGNPALLEGVKGNRFTSLTLHGKSTQGSTTGAQLLPFEVGEKREGFEVFKDGIAISGARKNDIYAVGRSGMDKPAQKLIIPTPNGLPGVPTIDNGNYTDASGQQWLCDEVDLKRGVYVQNVAFAEFGKGITVLKKNNAVSNENFVAAYFFTSPSKRIKTRQTILSNCLSYVESVNKVNKPYSISNEFDTEAMYVTITTELYENDVQMLNLLAEKKIKILYATYPTERPLSTEELEKYRSLRTYSPTTTVINDAGAGMSVGYAKMK